MYFYERVVVQGLSPEGLDDLDGFHYDVLEVQKNIYLVSVKSWVRHWRLNTLIFYI